MTATAGNIVELLTPYKRLESTNRYTIVTGGRGGAKSFHVSVFLLLLTYSSNEVILFTRYTMASARISIIPEFIEKMELWGIEHDFVVNKDEITNKHTGSKILFRGIKTSSGNQTANLKSIQGVTCWVLDEAEELVDEQIFDKINLSIRTKGATNKVILVLNPSHVQHWIYKKYFDKGQLDGVTYIHTTYLDNLKNLDASFINEAEALKEKDFEKYRQIFLGEWGSTADSVFPAGYKTYTNEPDDIDWEILGGDFGYSTDPSCLVSVKKKGNELYIKEVFYERALPLDSIAKRMAKDGTNQQRSVWDSADKTKIIDLRLMNVDAVGARKGFVFVRLEKIKRFDIFIHKDSMHTQNEFDCAVWAKDTDGTYKRNTYDHLIMHEESPKKDHCLDAIGYALSYYYDMTGL